MGGVDGGRRRHATKKVATKFSWESRLMFISETARLWELGVYFHLLLRRRKGQKNNERVKAKWKIVHFHKRRTFSFHLLFPPPSTWKRCVFICVHIRRT